MKKIREICGSIVDYRGVQGEYCIKISNGRITGFKEKPSNNGLNYMGEPYIIIPGLVDIHVHLRGLKLSYKEDEKSGSMQALASGITLVVDMPNTKPELRDPQALSMKLEALNNKSYVDFGVYAGIPSNELVVDRLVRAPIAGFKAYPNDLNKYNILQKIMKTGRLLVVHSEDPGVKNLLEYEELKVRSEIRGCHIEGIGLEYISSLEGRIHVTHTSCPTTITHARSLGYTIDVTPHHILYDYYNVIGDCLYRVNPPLRDPQNRIRLLELLLLGEVNAIASDHAPHARWEKEEPLTCRPGIPWLGIWSWIIYRHLVFPGRLSLEKFLYLTSRGPSEVLGLVDYGLIEEDARANIVVLDPKYRWRHTGFHYSLHHLPSHFMKEAMGRPIAVIVGGVLAYTYEKGVIAKPPTLNAFTG